MHMCIMQGICIDYRVLSVRDVIAVNRADKILVLGEFVNRDNEHIF